MPRAEERAAAGIAKGQAYGAATEQQQFVDQASEQGVNPGVAEGGVTPFSPVQEPVLETPQQEKYVPPPAEQEPDPQIEPNTGINLYDFLAGPTQRPAEPVTAGLGIPGSSKKVKDVLREVASVNASPDVRLLLQVAEGLDI